MAPKKARFKGIRDVGYWCCGRLLHRHV